MSINSKGTASPKSPVTINEFPEENETTMICHLRLLPNLDILQPIWENQVRTICYYELGRQIAILLKINKSNHLFLL